MSLTASAEWAALKAHHEETKKLHMRDLFARDSDRFKNFRLALRVRVQWQLAVAIATHNFSNCALYYKCHTSIGTRLFAHVYNKILVVKSCI